MNANTETSAMSRKSAPESWVSSVWPIVCPAMISRTAGPIVKTVQDR